MTAVRTAVPATVPPDTLSGPTPRRVRPPRWFDLRLVLGVLLVLGSVLLGARVVGAADATVPVWAVQTDLAAGTELHRDDLVAVDVRLDEAAHLYLSAGTRPEGDVLARAVRAGELLPRSALEEPAQQMELALPVQAGYLPPGLTRGEQIDVYAVAAPSAGAVGIADGSVDLVVGRATVRTVSGAADGVLATPNTTVQVVVTVPAAGVADVLRAISGRPLVVVVHDSVDSGAEDGNAQTPAPSVPAPSVPAPSVPAPSVPAGPTG